MAVKGVLPLDPAVHFYCATCGRLFNRTELKYYDSNEHCSGCWELAGEPMTSAPPETILPVGPKFFACENCGRRYNETARDPETDWCVNCRKMVDDAIAEVDPDDASPAERKASAKRREEAMVFLEGQVEKVKDARATREEEIKIARETGDVPPTPPPSRVPDVDESTPSMSGDRGSDGQ